MWEYLGWSRVLGVWRHDTEPEYMNLDASPSSPAWIFIFLKIENVWYFMFWKLTAPNHFYKSTLPSRTNFSIFMFCNQSRVKLTQFYLSVHITFLLPSFQFIGSKCWAYLSTRYLGHMKLVKVLRWFADRDNDDNDDPHCEEEEGAWKRLLGEQRSIEFIAAADAAE